MWIKKKGNQHFACNSCLSHGCCAPSLQSSNCSLHSRPHREVFCTSDNQPPLQLAGRRQGFELFISQHTPALVTSPNSTMLKGKRKSIYLYRLMGMKNLFWSVLFQGSVTHLTIGNLLKCAFFSFRTTTVCWAYHTIYLPNLALLPLYPKRSPALPVKRKEERKAAAFWGSW